jgi:hypothetical protein
VPGDVLAVFHRRIRKLWRSLRSRLGCLRDATGGDAWKLSQRLGYYRWPSAMAIVILGSLATSTALNLLVLPTLAFNYERFEPTPEK